MLPCITIIRPPQHHSSNFVCHVSVSAPKSWFLSLYNDCICLLNFPLLLFPFKQNAELVKCQLCQLKILHITSSIFIFQDTTLKMLMDMDMDNNLWLNDLDFFLFWFLVSLEYIPIKIRKLISSLLKIS